MDQEERSKDSSPAARKVPLEELSKEDLLKKYKSALLLAQKAKQAKDEYGEEIIKKNLVISTLEEKCQMTEHDLKTELHHSKKIQEQLQATQELLASQQKLQCETETLVEERVAAITASVKAENAELLKELNVMNQVLKQRGELISKMTASHADYTRQIEELEVSLSNTNKELHVKTAELENLADFTRQLTELKSTLSTMSRDLLEKDKKIEALTKSRDETESIRVELMQKASFNNELQATYEEEKCKLLQTLEEKENSLLEIQRELCDVQNQLRDVQSLNEELEVLKTELALKTKELDKFSHLQESFNSLQRKITSVTVEKDEELTKLRAEIINLVKQLEESCTPTEVQEQKEYLEGQAILHQIQLDSYKQQCNDLMGDLESKNHLLEHLKSLKASFNKQKMELEALENRLETETEEKLLLDEARVRFESQLDLMEQSLVDEKNRSALLEKSCLEKENLIQELQALQERASVEDEACKATRDRITSLEDQVLNLTSSLEIKDRNIQALQEILQQKSESIAAYEIQLKETGGQSEALLSDLQCRLVEAEKREQEKKEEVVILGHSVDSLSSQNDDLEKQLNEKNACINSYETDISELKKELHTLNESVVCINAALVEKNEMILSKDESISNLSAESKRIQEELMLLHKSLTKTELECHQYEESALVSSAKMVELQSVLDQQKNDFLNLQSENQKINREQHNSSLLLKELENQKEDIQIKYETTIASECELKNQVIALQETVKAKEAQILNLEQELSKIKDIAHDSTNTEVSSTYSMSQAEEHARLRDLEDSFEDKYTKLRVVAVKLKKRVSELTQTLESERNKTSVEKTELQSKLAQLANHAKTTQTLQSEVDRLEDKLEEQRKCQLQLSKDFDAAMQDATSAKSQLAVVQEQLHNITQERNSLLVSKEELEASLSRAEALNSETERLCKEIREKELQLEQCIDEKRKLSEQLEKACADAKKKSVLSLEIEDMEKSVFELTQHLNNEKALSKSISIELEQERVLSSSLREQLKTVEEKIREKEQAILTFEGKLSSAHIEVEDYKRKIRELEELTKQLQVQVETHQSMIEELNIQCSDLASKQVMIEENARQQVEALGRQVFQLEELCSNLKDTKSITEAELAAVRSEFEGYKVRAQSVLRQSTRQEERSAASRTVHDTEELELEVERLRVSLNNLKSNHQRTITQLEAALQETNNERDEKSHALKSCQSLREACNAAAERQHAAEEKLAAALEEARQAKLHADMLVQCYKQQIEDLKTAHNKKVYNLTEQVEKLQASINNTVKSTEIDQTSGVRSGTSPIAEWASNAANVVHPDSDLAMRMSSLTREEGEGSESIDSYPSRRISVTSHERRHELVPLDKLLSSSSYPEDEGSAGVELASSSQLNIDTLQSKLNACEARVSHLTALLSEAESDAARFSQLNAVLKEEIRRQQRSEERTQHAHNLEYLKNIVVKFVTLQSGDERQRLVPVLNTILKLSPEEAGLIASVAKGTPQTPAGSRGWGSYLPIPGWSGS